MWFGSWADWGGWVLCCDSSYAQAKSNRSWGYAQVVHRLCTEFHSVSRREYLWNAEIRGVAGMALASFKLLRA